MMLLVCNGKDDMPASLNQFRDGQTSITRGPITREAPAMLRLMIAEPRSPGLCDRLLFAPSRGAEQFQISEEELLDFTATTEHDMAHHVTEAARRLGRRGEVELEDTGRTVVMSASRIEHRPGETRADGFVVSVPLDVPDGFDVRLANLPGHVVHWLADHADHAPDAVWSLTTWTPTAPQRALRETWLRLEDLALVPERLPHGELGVSALWFARPPEGTCAREKMLVDGPIPAADPIARERTPS